MELVSARPTVWGRIAPLACGCALAAGAALVAVADPGAAGSRFPACTFHQLTGLWCPGCGLTRGTHQLLNGDIAAAVTSNLFTPLVVLAIAGAWWAWLRTAWGRPTRRLVDLAPRRLGPVLLVAVLAFGVVRNVPFAPLRALAP